MAKEPNGVSDSVKKRCRTCLKEVTKWKSLLNDNIEYKGNRITLYQASLVCGMDILSVAYDSEAVTCSACATKIDTIYRFVQKAKMALEFYSSQSHVQNAEAMPAKKPANNKTTIPTTVKCIPKGGQMVPIEQIMKEQMIDIIKTDLQDNILERDEIESNVKKLKNKLAKDEFINCMSAALKQLDRPPLVDQTCIQLCIMSLAEGDKTAEQVYQHLSTVYGSSFTLKFSIKRLKQELERNLRLVYLKLSCFSFS
jgi:hypothetical protein